MTTAPVSEQRRAVPRAAAMAEGWTRWYTSRVPGEPAERRRAEIASDLWEQLADGRDAGAAPGAVAASITWRVVAGVPADLSWMHQQRAISRGVTNRERESIMNTFTRLVGRWWWVILALGVAAAYILIAVGNLTDAGYIEAGYLGLAIAALIVVGAVLRVWFPFAGGLLVVAGTGPGTLIWWAPILASLAVLVVVGALIDLVIIPAARRQIGAGATVGRVAALVAAVIATVAPLAVGAFPGIVVTGVVAAVLIVVGIVRRSQHPTPTSGATATA